MADSGQQFRNRRQNVVDEFNARIQAERDSFSIIEWYWSTHTGDGAAQVVADTLGIDVETISSMKWRARLNADTAALDDMAQAAGFYDMPVGVERDKAKWVIFMAWLDSLQ